MLRSWITSNVDKMLQYQQLLSDKSLKLKELQVCSDEISYVQKQHASKSIEIERLEQ